MNQPEGPNSQEPEPIPPHPLDYAPDPRRARWRRRILRFVAIALITSTAGFTYAYRREIALRAQLIYWARQCANHVTPPGTLLVENDDVKAQLMAKANPDYVLGTVSGFSGMGQNRLPSRAEYQPRAWREYERLVMQTPFVGQMQMQQGYDSAVVFLGSRKTPSGTYRIVVIRGTLTNALAFDPYIQFSSTILPQPNLIGTLPVVNAVNRLYQNGRFVDAELEPGVADPTDPTHLTINFTIPFRRENRPPRKGTLDIYLRDNDTLDVRVRDPATTQGV